MYFRPEGKTYPISDQNGQNLYPFSDQNGSKTIPFDAAHTYIAYIREYPPHPLPEDWIPWYNISHLNTVQWKCIWLPLLKSYFEKDTGATLVFNDDWKTYILVPYLPVDRPHFYDGTRIFEENITGLFTVYLLSCLKSISHASFWCLRIVPTVNF